MRNERGFTLIEVMIVVTIIAIISFTAAAMTSQTFLKSEISIESVHLIDTIRLAQSRSISGYQDGIWGVHMTGSTYTLFKGATYAGRDATYDQVHNLPSGIAATGLTDVIFEMATGETSNVGTITITQQSSGDDAVITINAQGRITDL